MVTRTPVIRPQSDPVQRYRARLIVGLTLSIFLLLVIFGFSIRTDSNTAPLLTRFPSDPVIQFAYIGSAIVSVLTVYAVLRGRMQLAAAGPAAIWFIGVVTIAFNGSFSNSTLIIAIFIILGGLTLGRAGLLVTAIIGITAYLFSVSRVDDPLLRSQIAATLPQLLVLAVLAFLYLETSQRQREQVAKQSEAERVRLIDIAGSIAQQIAQRRSTDDVLNGAISQILENYPAIYHAQVFLIDDEGDQAQLRASTGEAGRVLLQRHHSLQVGSRSVIGQVTALGQPVIARANASESVHRANDLLRETQVEMAFPLRVGSRTIGALDIQSRLADGINESDIPVFQLLADTIAVALDNGELFRLTQERLRENQKLIEQMSRSAAEVRQLNEQLTQGAWSRFLEPYTGRVGIEAVLTRSGGDVLSQVTPWREGLTPLMRDTVIENNPIQRPTADGLVVCIPLRVRGLPLGALEVELEDRAPLSDEEIDLAVKLGERFGTMVEALRVTEESRRSAQRESVLNTISARLQSSYEVDQLLGEAARGLQGALGARRIAIRLGRPEGEAAVSGAGSGVSNGSTNGSTDHADERNVS